MLNYKRVVFISTLTGEVFAAWNLQLSERKMEVSCPMGGQNRDGPLVVKTWSTTNLLWPVVSRSGGVGKEG